jgi:hypothetical protein
LILNKNWSIFVAVKFLYMFFALFVYSNFTSLGDTFGYLSGMHYNPDKMFFESTNMIGTVAYWLNLLFGQTLSNIPFLILSIYGIYFSVSRIELTKKQLSILLILLSFPSFGVWTSIASKETVSVFFMGIILGFIIDIIKRRKINYYILLITAFYLCLLFKPQYLIGIVSLLIYLFIARKLRLKGYGKLLLLILFFMVSFSILYIFRYEINALSFIMPIHFSMDAASTRQNTIWVHDFDVFYNALYGMYISFVGPTIYEASHKFSHLFAWIESMVILCLFIIAILKLLFITYKTNKVNIFYLSVFLSVSMWILFVHYPFGALNPGSAIRYRENFYGFLVILFYFLYTEILKEYHYSYILSKKD